MSKLEAREKTYVYVEGLRTDSRTEDGLHIKDFSKIVPKAEATRKPGVTVSSPKN